MPRSQESEPLGCQTFLHQHTARRSTEDKTSSFTVLIRVLIIFITSHMLEKFLYSPILAQKGRRGFIITAPLIESN